MLTFRRSHGTPDAPLNARFSGGSTSGTSAGGPLPVQPSRTPAQSPEFNTFTRTHPAGEGFEPGWRRSGLPASTSARSNNRIHEKSPVLSHINPRRGSTKGGDEIYLIVRDLPPTTDLYARFGGEIVPTVSSPTGSDPAERKGCTDSSSLVSPRARRSFMPSSRSGSSRSRRSHTLSDAFPP